ncbi:hypothetical protein AMJ44_08940, partial [candidate division WOR-1 bacterium DG_54_3]
YIKEKISRQWGALTGLGEMRLGFGKRAKLELIDTGLNVLGRFHVRYLQMLGVFKNEFSYLPLESWRVKLGKKRGAMEIKSMDGQALNNSPDLICYYDNNHNFKRVNVTLLKELGYESTDLIGRSFETLVYPDDVPLARERFASLMATGESNPCEFRIKKKDGSYIWGWSIGQVLVEKGKKAGVVVTIRDITQRKEQEISKIIRQRLETLRVIWRGINQELNNAMVPLRQLEALLIKLEEGKVDNQTAMRILRNMIINARRIAELSDRLQYFAYFSGVAKVRVDLQRLVNAIFDLMKAEFDQEDIDVFREYSPARERGSGKAFMIDAHFNGLQIVLMDLLKNAADAICRRRAGFMDDDRYEDYRTFRGKIKISLRPEAQGEEQELVLSIRDNGCGIEPEVLGKIFDPFFTTKPIGEGNGLGLTLVQQVIKEHEGTIDFQSEPGLGTEVTIRLPVS